MLAVCFAQLRVRNQHYRRQEVLPSLSGPQGKLPRLFCRSLDHQGGESNRANRRLLVHDALAKASEMLAQSAGRLLEQQIRQLLYDILTFRIARGDASNRSKPFMNHRRAVQ